MFEIYNQISYTPEQWAVLMFCAFLVGVSKTGFPGMGIINIPIMAIMFPAKISTGLILPMLAFADLFAVGYYRRHAHWNHVFKLLPWALFGIGVGSVVMIYISDEQLEPLIGIIVLVMLGLNYWRNRHSDNLSIPSHWSFAALMGFAAGITTQLANAAGPVMTIYLLAMQLPKNEFIGTGAWYFLILNWLKMGLFGLDGRITSVTLATNVMLIPVIAMGAFAGFKLVKIVPQKHFNNIVQALAAVAALKLASSLFNFF
ncbi:MAG: hypothetical protein CSYNP_04490 [Syntrophus sp. SKADARSKE-3]|nr:hypothetical protein [Syntrophus sp. SKADARSKE-3]